MMLMLIGLFLAVALPGGYGGPLFHEGQYDVPNDTMQCANDLIDWCQGMKYPDSGISISTVSVTFMEPEGICQYFCSSDRNSTKCTKNDSPWLSCNKDGQFTYKGNELTKDSTINATDDDICKAADRAFNDLFVQNFSYDNSTMTEFGDIMAKNMEAMMKMMADVQAYVQRLNEFLMNPMPSGFFFGSGPMAPPQIEESSEEKNSIERET